LINEVLLPNRDRDRFFDTLTKWSVKKVRLRRVVVPAIFKPESRALFLDSG